MAAEDACARGQEARSHLRLNRGLPRELMNLAKLQRLSLAVGVHHRRRIPSLPIVPSSEKKKGLTVKYKFFQRVKCKGDDLYD